MRRNLRIPRPERRREVDDDASAPGPDLAERRLRPTPRSRQPSIEPGDQATGGLSTGRLRPLPKAHGRGDARLPGRPPRRGRPRASATQLAERFDAQLDRPVHELSTGNRQKLGLIQAFMHEPELLILDEPIAGLDPLVQQSFHGLLEEVASEGRTVFLSSHTLSEVERVAHRVAILRRGRLAVVDSLENLRAIAIRKLEIEFGPAAPRTRGSPSVARRAGRDDRGDAFHRLLRGLGRPADQGNCRLRGALDPRSRR